MIPSASEKVGRVLITNDDGINAPGLKVLEEIAAEIADEVWVFAPDRDCTGFGRSMTLYRDISVTEIAPRRYSCDGTPVDCVLLALNHFMVKNKPDLVMSGINRGMNVADNITCSGTIGAAWEATVHGIHSVALSQKMNFKNPPVNPLDAYAVSRAESAPLMRKLIKEGWPKDAIINVNFPNPEDGKIKGTLSLSVGRHKEADEVIETGKGNAYRIGLLRQRGELKEHHDFYGVMNDYISVTPLSLDMTHENALENLKAIL